jgi:hypothetical protein
MTREFRELRISDEDMDAGNAADVIRLFNDAISVPRNAKLLRGSIVFAFGRFDRDPRPNFVIPEVRGFTQLVDQAHPHFCYFLPEAPETTQIYSWLMSLAHPEEPILAGARGIKVNPGKFIELIIARIEAVRRLCTRILDDPTETEKAIQAAMPEPLVTLIRAQLSGPGQR